MLLGALILEYSPAEYQAWAHSTAWLSGHLKMQYFCAPPVAAVSRLRQAFKYQLVVRTHPAHDFLPAPGDTDGTAADLITCICLDYQAGHALTAQQSGLGQTDWAAAHDQDGDGS